MESLVTNLLNGLSWGMLLFLISVRLTTVFGVLGVLNFAHGSFFMLGAYLCMQVIHVAPSFWIGILIGPLAVALLLGLLESFGTVFAGRAQMALPYILLALILLVRPRGFFGRET